MFDQIKARCKILQNVNIDLGKKSVDGNLK